jgi:hypothetical protein
VTKIRGILSLALPPLYVALLVVCFPLFDAGFSEGLSYLRFTVGALAARAGVVPDARGVLLGIYKPEVPYSFTRLDTLERDLGKRFDIISLYQTWGEREEDKFPQDLLLAIDRRGAMAMVTWEPWVSEFASNKGDAANAPRSDLQGIADGAYDDYIRQWAKEAVVFGRPFFLRFAHEMNNRQYPWAEEALEHPDRFVAGWRHVWTIFRSEGAKNVIWVWSPRGEMPRQLYPGGAYVDWVGAAVFNYGAYGENVWNSFEYLYEPMYRSALQFEKPIMIAELGCSPSGGSEEQWYADALRKLPVSYRRTKAVVLYNNPADRTLSGSSIDWSVDHDPEIVRIIKESIDKGVFKNH